MYRVKNKNSSKRKALLLGLIFFCIIAGALVGFGFGRGEYRTSSDFHQYNLQALANAMNTTKKQAHEIAIPGTIIYDQGNDERCTIGRTTELGSWQHDVHCLYRYDVIYVGSDDFQKDTGTLYQRIRQAGWTTTGGNGDNSNIDSNGLYTGPESVYFKKSDSLVHTNYLSLNVFDSNHVYSSGDILYRQLAQQFITTADKYIYGITIQYSYVDTHCTFCEESRIAY